MAMAMRFHAQIKGNELNALMRFIPFHSFFGDTVGSFKFMTNETKSQVSMAHMNRNVKRYIYELCSVIFFVCNELNQMVCNS